MIIDHPVPGELPALRQLWKQAFGDDDRFINCFFETAFFPERCLRIPEGDSVAAGLYWLDCRLGDARLAYLYAVATAEAFRGRGLCRALMDRTHAHLQNLGYAGTLLVPGSPGLTAMYEAMGYRTCTTIREFSCGTGSAPTSVRAVGPEEYTGARRALLPPGGVCQEGASIAFLQTQARLYAGDGFVLAAREESGVLFGLELLGDASAAPGIVAALGCREGRFRAPGPGKPFAMYRPLSPTPPPDYFGLAFD